MDIYLFTSFGHICFRTIPKVLSTLGQPMMAIKGKKVNDTARPEAMDVMAIRS
jgi:hypothetical protein